MKVLYADAKNMWHKLMEKVLEPRGVEIVHAYSLKEVLNKINSEKPEVAILNVSLRNGKAYEIIPNIFSLGVPVILIGLKSEGLDEEKAKALGVKFVLPKPFTVDDLFRAINEARLEKPKVEDKEELPAIVHSGGVKEPVEDEEVIDLTPVEQEQHVDELEVEPIVTEASVIPKIEDEHDELVMEPSEEGVIEIEPVSDLSIEEETSQHEELSLEPEEKDMLSKAFGITKEGDVNSSKEEEEIPVVEENVQSEMETEKEEEKEPEVLSEPESEGTKEIERETEKVALSTQDFKELKEEVKAKILKDLEKEIREEIRAVIWEVIPDMAEKVIREEIEKFIKSRLV
ncbi:response regulator [Desulfurobacterium atlanticum]|uniref:Response regulator receiver domain-containing protein n=1 Tax=Desulfurobacterium atlanticum TaxID=240169 RepID=A0A238XUZ6_9BACT|nr:response regulator [Desulfurobacterium atlanticum]SNR62144.1 Response regulator receiver domain-containing protein [Desulfurobacterium atlanticum]